MRKLFFAIVIGCLAFVPLASQAQPLRTVPGDIVVVVVPAQTPSPTPEDYEKALNNFKKISGKAFNYEAWKDVKFVNRVTKVEKKFGDLNDLQQNVFMLEFAEDLTEKMASLQKAWDDELKAFENPKHVLVPQPVIENQKQNAARKADVVEYHKQLLDLRKKFAVEYEEFAECFLNCECKVGEKEREYTLGLIRKANDALKLIDRKKE